MMHTAVALLLAGFVGADSVVVTTLDGAAIEGAFVSLSAESAVVSVDGTETTVPATELATIQLGDSPAASPVGPRAYLSDGSEVSFSELSATADKVTLKSETIGTLNAPLRSLMSVRLGDSTPTLEREWQDFRTRELTRDLIVLKKKTGEGLDFTRGVLGTINSETVNFVLSGDSIPIPASKLFGVIYARRELSTAKPMCEVSTANGDRLRAAKIQLTGEQLKVQLLSGASLNIPLGQLSTLDFSLGRIQYLSEMEPVAERFYSPALIYDAETDEPVFDNDADRDLQTDLFRFRANMTEEGQPLRLGGRTYQRGLWIHSKKLLVFRLSREYRTFRAVMGIDDAVSQTNGKVEVVISGDGETLFKSEVKAGDKPVELKLDVTDIRDLEIFVGHGGNGGFSDWLDLADARVIR